VIAPLGELLSDGLNQINMRRAEYAIQQRVEGTDLEWNGWYDFLRGMATNLFRLGYKAQEAALILRNSPEVVRKTLHSPRPGRRQAGCHEPIGTGLLGAGGRPPNPGRATNRATDSLRAA